MNAEQKNKTRPPSTGCRDIVCRSCGITVKRHSPATLCLDCQNARHAMRGKDRRKLYPDRRGASAKPTGSQNEAVKGQDPCPHSQNQRKSASVAANGLGRSDKNCQLSEPDPHTGIRTVIGGAPHG